MILHSASQCPIFHYNSLETVKKRSGSLYWANEKRRGVREGGNGAFYGGKRLDFDGDFMPWCLSTNYMTSFCLPPPISKSLYDCIKYMPYVFIWTENGERNEPNGKDNQNNSCRNTKCARVVLINEILIWECREVDAYNARNAAKYKQDHAFPGLSLSAKYEIRC